MHSFHVPAPFHNFEPFDKPLQFPLAHPAAGTSAPESPVPQRKMMVIGLNCAEPSLVIDRWWNDLPNLREIEETGTFGRLRSCDPPTTVPAWSVNRKDGLVAPPRPVLRLTPTAERKDIRAALNAHHP